MLKLVRHQDNPIVLPSLTNEWESAGAFNGCVIKHNDSYVMVYRAMTPRKSYINAQVEVSTVGVALGDDPKSFGDHYQLIAPVEDWEKYGCEDPRVTKVGDEYYIFYTALSGYPFGADNIKVALAVTRDFKTIERRNLVTPFNAKAMSLFPDKVNGKYAAILTANTDTPPSYIAIAYFDKIEEIWSENFWKSWYLNVEGHSLNLLRSDQDHVEVGGPPVKTKDGWLLVYSYIQNYFSDEKIFGIEAVLLDLDDPFKIIKRTEHPLMTPETPYELYGNIPNITFPSGAMVEDDTLYVYYGAADTSTAVATCSLDALLKEMKPVNEPKKNEHKSLFTRFHENPILIPIPEHQWESKAVYNPAAIYEDGTVHILYRAQSDDDVSTFGYATSQDGFHIDERLPYPVYVPREQFEMKVVDAISGCEDPRIVKIDDRFYVCYTAYDGGASPPKVAMTSIRVKDFLDRNWAWEKPIIISPPDIDDKDACLFPKKINGKYVFFHRISGNIWIDYRENLDFSDGRFLGGEVLMEPNKKSWDNHKIGIAGPPIETKDGWLLLYHGVDTNDERVYKVGAVLLDLEKPSKVIQWLSYPIFEPETRYEMKGQVDKVVFPCGQAIVNGEVFLYYGGADSVVGVAQMNLDQILDLFKK